MGFVNGENQDMPSVLTGTPSVSTVANLTSPVGPYAITLLVGSLRAPNYTFTFQTGTLNVTPVQLTVSNVLATQVYGSSTVTTQSFTITGFANGQTLATSGVTGTPGLTTTATPSTPVGNYAATPNLGTLQSTNYSFAFAPGAATLQITSAPLVVTAVSQSRSYGDVNPAFTYRITGFVGSDFLDQSLLSGTPVFTTTAAGPASPVGNYAINIAPGSLAYANANYTLDPTLFRGGVLAVTQAPLTIALNLPSSDLTRLYGQANPAKLASMTLADFDYTGFVNGQDQAVLSGLPSVSTLANLTSPVGTYAITIQVGSLWALNYTFTFQSGTLNVTPVLLTVSDVVASRPYGSSTATTQSYTISGFANGETQATSDVKGTPGVTTTATASSPVGSYAGTPSQGTLQSTNYTFAFAPGAATLQITQATLTVTPSDFSRYYGLPNPIPLPSTITGYANGENATTGGVTGAALLFTTATADSPVGTYGITISQGTLAASNYTFQIATKPATLTVLSARLIVVASNVSRSFGTPNPRLGWSLVREDPPQTAISATDPDPLLSGAPALSTQVNIGNSVGTYPITAALGTLTIANPNYLLDIANFQTGTFTVTRATLTITAQNASRAYGAANPTFGYTLTGFIQGQDLANSGVAGAPSFTTTALTTSHVGTYTLTPSTGTLASPNYLLTFVSATLAVTPTPLLIKANNTSQGYGTRPSLSASYVGLVNGDTAASLPVLPSLSTTANVNSLPGSYPISVSGAAATDYTISYQGGTYTVQRAPTASLLEGAILRSAISAPVTFTADVNASSLGAIPVTGTVVFYDQFGMIGAVPVSGSKASLTISTLTAGNYMVHAVYVGDSNYATSATATIDQMILTTAPAPQVKSAAPVAVHPRSTARPVIKPKPRPRPVAPAPRPKPKPRPRVVPVARPRVAAAPAPGRS